MAVGVNIVIESVLDSRTDAEFHIGEELLKSLGEQVSRTVPESMLAFGVIPFEEPEGSILLNRAREIPFLFVNGCGEHFPCQLRREAARDFKRSDTALELFHRLVGKSNINHFKAMFINQLP